MTPTGITTMEELYALYPDLKKEDLEILDEWLKKQPHLPQLADFQKAGFLHSCYFRIEPTKITIDKYFTMKTHHPELWNHLDESTLRSITSVVHAITLPKKSPNDYLIFVWKLIDFRTENFNIPSIIALLSMVGTLYWYQKGTVKGFIAIFDAKGITLSHLIRFNMATLKIALDHLQEGVPLRIKGIHFVNTVPALEKFKLMIKPLLKTELYDLVQFHSSLETLFKEVPLECLPEDYGGDSPSCQYLHEKNLEIFLNNYDFFEWHDGQKVDESKRTDRIRISGFGAEGTFKKLQID